MESLITHPGAPSSRRDFFKRAGLGAGVFASAAALQACDSEEPDDTAGAVVLDFSTDAGVLNYAYALEQLEAAFYARVIADPAFSTTFNAAEQAVLRDVEVHERIHVAFLKGALGTSAIGNLTPDFTSVTFSNKMSVLATAVTFEDLGVAAYNGAAQYLTDVNNLLAAGKIVSVEARHASALRDLILSLSRSGATIGEAGSPNPPLLDVVGANALDRQLPPSAVLAAADPFITNTITRRGGA